MDARAQPGNAVRERRCHGHERERLFSRGLARAPGEGVRRNFYCDELSDGGVGVVLGMCQTTKLFEMIIPIRIITCTSHIESTDAAVISSFLSIVSPNALHYRGLHPSMKK